MHQRRAERRAERPRGQGPRLGSLQALPARRAGGVRPGLPVPAAACGGNLRGQVPVGDLDRPAAAGQAPGRGRPPGGCRRRGSRLHRKGQRPGALRADLQGPGAPPQGHRPLAAVGHPLAGGSHRLRPGSQHRPGQDHEEEHLFAGRQPLAPQPRGRRSRGSLEPPAGRDVPEHQVPQGRPRSRDACRSGVRARYPRGSRRQAAAARGAGGAPQPVGGRQRRGQGGHGGDPAGRDEEPRGLRDPRRHDPVRGSP